MFTSDIASSAANEMPAVNCLRGPYSFNDDTPSFFIDPNERPDFDRLYNRAAPYAMAIQRAGTCYIHACMNLLLNTTIGELYGLESYRRISDADNFGDIDHVISVAQDELMNVWTGFDVHIDRIHRSV
jgi:hypothetical protein